MDKKFFKKSEMKELFLNYKCVIILFISTLKHAKQCYELFMDLYILVEVYVYRLSYK